MWLPDTLVLGPCGIKGCFLLGALKVLEHEKLLGEIRSFVGVSSGAIISMFLAVGIDLDTVILMGMETDLLRDVTFDRIREQRALISSEKLREILAPLITKKFGKVPTFKELFELTGRSLTTVAFNLNKMTPRYFSHETTPSVDIVEAVIMSMAIPYLVQQIKYEGDVYVDGAFGDNYPIEYIDRGDNKILGMRVETVASEVINSIGIFPRVMEHLNVQLGTYRAKQGLNIRHLTLRSEVAISIPVTASREDKIRMLKFGYEQGRRFVDELNGVAQPLVVDAKDIPLPPEDT